MHICISVKGSILQVPSNLHENETLFIVNTIIKGLEKKRLNLFRVLAALLLRLAQHAVPKWMRSCFLSQLFLHIRL